MTDDGPLKEDQRRILRVAVDLPARARVGDGFVDGRAVNLSQHGMLFRASVDIAPAHELFVEIELPDSEGALVLGGDVCWRTPSHSGQRLHGISFARTPLAQRRRLA